MKPGLEEAPAMPMYEFTCKDCEVKFEELVFTTADEVACPRCKSTRVAKHLSTFAVGASGASSGGAQYDGCASGSCCSGGSCGF